ncbi:MAG: hypothetical protein HY305_04880, partial [Sphingobacteriales bacterium]|nr:hypothetical protein [Sphingobacteriales bacterium]
GDNSNSCHNLSVVKIEPIPVATSGDMVTLTAVGPRDAYYEWIGVNYSLGYDKTVTLNSVNFTDEGWYHLYTHLGTCNVRHDSVYVTVKFPQATVPCSPANNTAAFTRVSNQSFSRPYHDIDQQCLRASGSQGDIRIIFSSYWYTNGRKILDGVYKTTYDQTVTDYFNVGRVFIDDINNSTRWTVMPDQNVYVSHVAGKLCVTFCELDFSGSIGYSVYHVTASGKVTEY